MPLDTGSVSHTLRLVNPLDDRSGPCLVDFDTVGAYLKAARDYRGWGLVQLAEATRVRKMYLLALEQGDLASLPSRPFAVGYVRAYARALDLDEDAAVARFRAEAPDGSEPLRAPVGVKHERSGRKPLYVVAGVLVVGAVIGWNLVQRAMTPNTDRGPAALPAAAAITAEAPAPKGPITLGAPTPPPADQTTPAPYVTPGLGPKPDAGAPASAQAAKVAAGRATVPAPAPAVFAKGVVYGAAPMGPTILLQANKPSSLIVRGAGGEVYFARQLTAGEAYRAPIGQKLSAEAADPAAINVYIDGRFLGVLAATQTALDKAAAEAAGPADHLAGPSPRR